MNITVPIYAQGPNYANLRHPKSFPRFTTLPGDPPPGLEKDECDITYYDLHEVADDPDADPIRHWCLLAEILAFLRSAEITVIMVRDKVGRIVPVKVETEEYEQTFPVEQVVPGHAIALLYSVRETYKSALIVPVDDTEWVKECQQQGQNGARHKLECQIVADEDFQFMMTANWRVFEEDYYFFPTKREPLLPGALDHYY
ncbi:uncharacterized protein BDW47DRAFT_131099 [Aspergillus candidus]|uniref:Uncharacterized protein n=1 Tax=Aspergillus candidus TaxID=41067 RepID=A0A2I2FEH2_ASPCN|nr:hypothetical protein BDW47DRAFT_131099 [Aspergillus candidus]PLB39028.1 hypothetical protein BDW47DRAFT_131099 [Aspergillus candidus]